MKDKQLRRSLRNRLTGIIACIALSMTVFFTGLALAGNVGVGYGVYYTWSGWGIFCAARENGYVHPGAFGANWHAAATTYTRQGSGCPSPYTSNEIISAYVAVVRAGNTVCGQHYVAGGLGGSSQATALVLENSSPGFICNNAGTRTEIDAQHIAYWAGANRTEAWGWVHNAH